MPTILFPADLLRRKFPATGPPVFPGIKQRPGGNDLPNPSRYPLFDDIPQAANSIPVSENLLIASIGDALRESRGEPG